MRLTLYPIYLSFYYNVPSDLSTDGPYVLNLFFSLDLNFFALFLKDCFAFREASLIDGVLAKDNI